jgi:hypothetical protein
MQFIIIQQDILSGIKMAALNVIPGQADIITDKMYIT